jgi:predicted amidophosphoribosyltransferase
MEVSSLRIRQPPGMKFCGHCSTRLAALCAQCGNENLPGFKFCGECGSSLGSSKSENRPSFPKWRIIRRFARRMASGPRGETLGCLTGG